MQKNGLSKFQNNTLQLFLKLLVFQSVAAAASFFYSSHIALHAQLGILVLLATFGTISFCFVEWAARSKKAKGYNGAIDDPDLMDATDTSKHE
jgi:hypothetical protein